jgi:hypothetical protein
MTTLPAKWSTVLAGASTTLLVVLLSKYPTIFIESARVVGSVRQIAANNAKSTKLPRKQYSY